MKAFNYPPLPDKIDTSIGLITLVAAFYFMCAIHLNTDLCKSVSETRTVHWQQMLIWLNWVGETTAVGDFVVNIGTQQDLFALPTTYTLIVFSYIYSSVHKHGFYTCHASIFHLTWLKLVQNMLFTIVEYPHIKCSIATKYILLHTIRHNQTSSKHPATDHRGEESALV
jgi:hypothetical protein